MPGGCGGGSRPSSRRRSRPGRCPAPTARSAAGASIARRRLAAEDSLFRVANITRGQVAKLEAAGRRDDGGARRAPRAGARHGGRDAGAAGDAGRAPGGARSPDGPAFALRPAVPGKGFDLLPAPDPGDIFYDIEGDPHVEGGLEYLHGLWAPDTGFRAIWAHDRDAERAALVAVLDAFRARIAAHPGARIYHYASYEVTALRRLTALHGARRGLPRPAAARAAVRRPLRGGARRRDRLGARLFDQVARGLHRHRAGRAR